MNIIAQFKRLPISTKRLLSIALILAFVVALPLFVWAIVTQRFNILPRAASGELSNIINCSNVIADQFETSQLDTMRWTASDGNSIQQQNGVLRINGSANETAQHFLSYDKWIDGNFQMDVFVQSFTADGSTANDYATAELRAYFDDQHYFTIRWYKSPGGVSQINLWSTYNGSTDQGSPVNIPSNSSPILRLVRDGSEMHGYFNIGSGFQQVPDVPPGIFTGIVQPQLYSYKRGVQSTAVVYDNFIMGCAGQVSPYPRPTTPPSGSRCGICGGIANIQCQSGLNCYKPPRTTIPDSTGICIDSRGPGFCPGVSPSPFPTCQPRPACLDSNPRCLMREPIGGWCPTNCIRRPPGIVISPETKSGNPGDQIVYTVTVTDNDSATCTASAFSLSVKSIFTGWVTSLSNTLLKLVPSGKGTAQVSVTSPISPQPSPGPYSVQVGVSGPGGASIAHANYNVLPTTPPATVRPFVIKFKFAGVADDSASYAKLGSNAAKASVKFERQTTPTMGTGYVTPPIQVDYAGDGVYNLHFGILSNELLAGQGYSITVKGEKHVAIKFCQPSGQTTHCSGAGGIEIPAVPTQTVNLDFTGIALPPGDLYPQDGVVSTLGTNSDLARLLVLMAKPQTSLSQTDLLTGDLNYDGYINIKDLYLFRLTLQTRYDE